MATIRKIVDELFKLHSATISIIKIHQLIGSNVLEQSAVEQELAQLNLDKERIKKRIRMLVETL